VNGEEERGRGHTVSFEKCKCSEFVASYSQTLLIRPTCKHGVWKRRRQALPATGDNFTSAGFFDGLLCIGSDPQPFLRLDARP
jgi:hypothetical protein